MCGARYVPLCQHLEDSVLTWPAVGVVHNLTEMQQGACHSRSQTNWNFGQFVVASMIDRRCKKSECSVNRGRAYLHGPAPTGIDTSTGIVQRNLCLSLERKNSCTWERTTLQSVLIGFPRCH